MFQEGKLGTTAVDSHGDDCEATLGGSRPESLPKVCRAETPQTLKPAAPLWCAE